MRSGIRPLVRLLLVRRGCEQDEHATEQRACSRAVKNRTVRYKLVHPYVLIRDYVRTAELHATPIPTGGAVYILQ